MTTETYFNQPSTAPRSNTTKEQVVTVTQAHIRVEVIS